MPGKFLEEAVHVLAVARMSAEEDEETAASASATHEIRIGCLLDRHPTARQIG